MAQTWTQTGTRSAKVVCTTGTETPAAPAKGSVTVAFSTAVAGNTVTLRGLTFTAIANGTTPSVPTEFPVGAGGTANTDTGTAFVAALARTVGTHGCTGTNASGTVTVRADVYGPAGHYAITKVGSPITLGAAALAGGVAPVGVFLGSVGVVVAQAYAATTGQTVATGTYRWYWWNPNGGAGVYMPLSSLDDTGPAATRGVTLVGPSSGMGVPVMLSDGWLCCLPTGVTISAGNLVVEMSTFSAGPGQVGNSL